MTGTRRAAAVTVAAVSLAALSAVPALAAPQADPSAAESAAAHTFSGPLRDLQPATGGPFDKATARLVMVSPPGTASTHFVFVVTGIDRDAAGTTYGAHLHTGPCVEGNGGAAGPHYNTGGAPSPITEVWLDFTVNPGGVGVSTTTVPFVPTPDDRAVVIHQEPTQPNGTAGARQACLPVSW